MRKKTMTQHRLPARALALALGALLLAGCSTTAPPAASSDPTTSSGYPVTVRSCGVDYTYNKAPSRVLLGYPGTIATLDALGVANTAIGYTLADGATDATAKFKNLAETTPDYTPSREFLLNARPDLFLSNDEQQLTGDGAASKEDLASVPGNLYVLGNYCVGAKSSTTIDGVYADITNLGKIFQVEKAADALVTKLRATVAAAIALNTSTTPLSAAVVTIYDGKVYALSGANYATLPVTLGLKNVWASTANFSEISAETVLAARPDIILITYTGGATEKSEALSQANKLFAATPAALTGKVVAIPEDSFSSGGVNIVGVIEQAADEVFK